ncbi:MAG TPA: hypothetical protein VLB11_02415 [Methyloceanibacter sp.]|nr:hypothetical protein [Methyloceanibacter sp.]
MEPNTKSQPAAPRLFLPAKRALTVIGVLGLAAVSAALFLRYGIIQNSALGFACEGGEQSRICTFRLAAILLFGRGVFGWTALIAAGINLWRPNVVAFGIGVVFALLGLVLYNTRVSALAAALLVLSLARPSPGGK